MYFLNMQMICPIKVENKNVALVMKDDYGCKNSTLEQKGISQKQKMIVDQQHRDIKVLYIGGNIVKIFVVLEFSKFPL